MSQDRVGTDDGKNVQREDITAVPSRGIVVEGHFGRAFFMHELCAMLRGMAQCSETLGVARFSHEGCDITIYRSRRVDVHGVASEEEAI